MTAIIVTGSDLSNDITVIEYALVIQLPHNGWCGRYCNSLNTAPRDYEAVVKR